MTPTRRQLVGVLTAMALALAGASLHAQVLSVGPAPYIDAERGLSIDDVVALALGQSKRIAAARERVNVARGDRAQADLRANPQATFAQREQMAGPDRQTSIDFSWPLNLFRRPARRLVADRTQDVAEAELHEVEWQLAADVRRAAARALAAVRALDLTEQQAKALSELRDLVAASAEGGAVPRLDRDLADVEARRLEALVHQRRGDVDAAMANLKGLAGINVDSPLVLKAALEIETTTAVDATKRRLDEPNGSRIGDARPDVQKIGAQAAVAAAQQRALQQDARWDLDVTAGYMRTDMSFPQNGLGPGGAIVPIAGRFHELTFGGTIALPWFNRNQGAIAAASATERAALREREAAELEARAELRAATARWSAAQRATAVYTGGLLQLAGRNVDVIQQTYQAGRGTLNDVIAERRRKLDLEMGYAALLLDLYDADLDVRRALGVIR